MYGIKNKTTINQIREKTACTGECKTNKKSTNEDLLTNIPKEAIMLNRTLDIIKEKFKEFDNINKNTISKKVEILSGNIKLKY